MPTPQESDIQQEPDDLSIGRGLKHEAAERIFRLLQFLTANECTREDIFRHLALYYKVDGVAPTEYRTSRRVHRMFERDIQFLEGQGFEILRTRKKAQPTRYHLVRGSGPRAAFLFTQSEIESLALLHNMFSDPSRYTQVDPTHPLPQPSPRHPFADEMLALIEKLASTLPAEQRQTFDQHVRKPYIYFNLPIVTNYLPHRTTINTILQAIANRRQIRFTYTPTHSQQNDHEYIDPYYIIYLEGHLYLIGYHHKACKFLEYRIDRIQEKSLRLEPTPIDAERRRRPIEFCFWIDSKIAKQGLSQRWLSQTLEREESYLDEQGQEKRRVLVRATAYNGFRIIQQLLRYGDKAELVEPAHLRDQMKQVVKHMYGFYED